jgi:hypothetical protein
MENSERWTSHSAMSDLGRHGAAVAELPSGVGALNGVVQRVLIYTDWLGAYGVDESWFDRVSRNTLPVAERLSLVLGRDAGALRIGRSPAQRAPSGPAATLRSCCAPFCAARGLLPGCVAVLPRSFMTVGQAWTACRSGERDPGRFGHGAVKGLWFVKVNVVRDHCAINNRETSTWDGWREASKSKRIVSDQDCALLDDIAARPECAMIDINPDWQT